MGGSFSSIDEVEDDSPRLPRRVSAVHDVQNRAALRLHSSPRVPTKWDSSNNTATTTSNNVIESCDGQQQEEMKCEGGTLWDNEFRRSRDRDLYNDGAVSSRASLDEIHRKHDARSSGKSFHNWLSAIPFVHSPFLSRTIGSISIIGTSGSDLQVKPTVTQYTANDGSERRRIDQAAYDRYLVTDAFKLVVSKNLSTQAAHDIRLHSRLFPRELVGYQICLLFPQDIPASGFPPEDEDEGDDDDNGNGEGSGVSSYPPQHNRTREKRSPARGNLAAASSSTPESDGSSSRSRYTAASDVHNMSVDTVNTNIASLSDRIRVVIGTEKRRDPVSNKNQTHYVLLAGDGDVSVCQLKRSNRKPGQLFTVLRRVDDVPEIE
jgi:hypothetical protein